MTYYDLVRCNASQLTCASFNCWQAGAAAQCAESDARRGGGERAVSRRQLHAH